jgi:hypothetical protein
LSWKIFKNFFSFKERRNTYFRSWFEIASARRCNSVLIGRCSDWLRRWSLYVQGLWWYAVE